MLYLPRRTFLKTTAVASATAAFSARSWSQVAGANNTVRVAIAGRHHDGRDGRERRVETLRRPELRAAVFVVHAVCMVAVVSVPPDG